MTDRQFLKKLIDELLRRYKTGFFTFPGEKHIYTVPTSHDKILKRELREFISSSLECGDTEYLKEVAREMAYREIMSDA
jgi:hypothetical protein